MIHAGVAGAVQGSSGNIAGHPYNPQGNMRPMQGMPGLAGGQIGSSSPVGMTSMGQPGGGMPAPTQSGQLGQLGPQMAGVHPSQMHVSICLHLIVFSAFLVGLTYKIPSRSIVFGSKNVV